MGIIGTLHGLWTLLLLIVFAAIVAWAWSSKRKASFEEAARIPLEDDEERSGRDGGDSNG